MPTFSSSTLGSYTSKWLIGTGIFELLLATGFLAGGFFASSASAGLWLTAAILGATGFALVAFGVRSGARAAAAQRVLDTGVPGQATITSVTQTGMFLNENPQVEMHLAVQVPGRPPYPATRKEFVPLILLGRLTSGVPLAVKVDPANPSNVIIDWQAAPGAAAMAMAPGTGPDETLQQVQQAISSSGLQASSLFSQQEQAGYTVEQVRNHLRANGVSGTATIEQVQDTGKVVGDEHVFIMETTIHVPGRPPHRSAASAAMVPAASVGRVALGATIPVKVAPDNPDVVMFEWDKF